MHFGSSAKVVEPVKDVEPEAVDADAPKPKLKEAPLKRSKIDAINDPETQENTRLNALIYHTSDETVDLYKKENNSSDLLGRLYFDDYDSDSITSPQLSVAGTPILSPNVTGGTNPIVFPHADYFQARLTPLLSANSSRAPAFERGISFDTSTDDHRRSLTVKVKHPQFKFRRNNKTYLAGYNSDVESLKAIEWLFDEMVVTGDTIIILQVLDEKKYHEIDKIKAASSLEKIEQLNTHKNKKIQFVYEIVIGKPEKTLKNAIREFNPQMMIIGTHHYDSTSSSKSFLSKASFSKHFLECALVPVIVVKPTYKYNEFLENPIDSESYFEDWIKSIEHSTSATAHKQRQPLPQQRFSMKLLSPSTSRTNSYTNLASQAYSADSDRGRQISKDNQPFAKEEHLTLDSKSRSRSTSKSRGFSKFFHHS